MPRRSPTKWNDNLHIKLMAARLRSIEDVLRNIDFEFVIDKFRHRYCRRALRGWLKFLLSGEERHRPQDVYLKEKQRLELLIHASQSNPNMKFKWQDVQDKMGRGVYSRRTLSEQVTKLHNRAILLGDLLDDVEAHLYGCTCRYCRTRHGVHHQHQQYNTTTGFQQESPRRDRLLSAMPERAIEIVEGRLERMRKQKMRSRRGTYRADASVIPSPSTTPSPEEYRTPVNTYSSRNEETSIRHDGFPDDDGSDSPGPSILHQFEEILEDTQYGEGQAIGDDEMEDQAPETFIGLRGVSIDMYEATPAPASSVAQRNTTEQPAYSRIESTPAIRGGRMASSSRHSSLSVAPPFPTATRQTSQRSEAASRQRQPSSDPAMQYEAESVSRTTRIPPIVADRVREDLSNIKIVSSCMGYRFREPNKIIIWGGDHQTRNALKRIRSSVIEHMRAEGFILHVSTSEILSFKGGQRLPLASAGNVSVEIPIL